MKERIICGIDLGTTNSVLAVLRDGRPEAVPMTSGSPILPSVVSLDEARDQFLVGHEAWHRMAAFPEATVRSVKRLMGKAQPILLGKRHFRPEEISAEILRHLITTGSKVLGAPITQAVITVPAYFDDAQRRATVRAGELAGLEVLRIINEPTAAALIYDHLQQEADDPNPYVLVYDLGGGTFDVSVLEIKGEIKEVLASGGDTALGGDDFDERLRELFLRHLRKEYGQNLESDFGLQVRLREIAEKTKIALSEQNYVQVEEAALTMVDGEPIHLRMEVSRAQFEELTADLVQKTTEKVLETLREADLQPEEIAKVILVGGATRMPAVQHELAELFGHKIQHSVDPDLCVALGAAIQAGLIVGEPLGHILLDVTAHSLGVQTIDAIDPVTGEADYFSTIIRRNSRIPVKRSEMYRTIHKNQKAVEVSVYQGESQSCKENTLIGSFIYDLKPAPAHSPISITFAYDREGIVHVTVEQKGYQPPKTVTLDVRRRDTLEENADPERFADAGPVNYVSAKARQLLQSKGLPSDVERRLRDLTHEYEAALGNETSDDLIDRLEDELLEWIEIAEERLEASG
ncbi:molecular chaperone DnaK [Desulfacinum hydrothermale DSM 13146]|uniref:Molecular chaperone DnaK n=1 Tax=Desulfacinum hydrothermale DSM 13146 TaxID=1121390 RepID=A0A1W1XV30_9BACT|nr:Hsp70 family protein [Desulfacinum hydrothermale]SMC27803.1 molecular chaperone DnaK [Desulfacinum hydrothermale DSM 13146]